MKTIGILGGMGPQATIRFYQHILDNTVAERDQDHVPTYIDSNTAVPDRTRAMKEGRATDVAALLTASAKRLESAGAALIAMPCNTAHAWLEDLRTAVAVPVLDMPALCGQFLLDAGHERTVGLLSTEGTRDSRLYQKAFKPFGLEVLPLNPSLQSAVNGVISAVKSGQFGTDEAVAIRAAVDGLLSDGASVVVLGCTELPLTVEHDTSGWVDPMQVMARHAIHACGGQLKPR